MHLPDGIVPLEFALAGYGAGAAMVAEGGIVLVVLRLLRRIEPRVLPHG